MGQPAEKSTVTFAPGEMIAIEGEPGGDLLIIKTGVAEVFRTREGQDMILAHVGSGEILGVMTATNGGERKASVRAKTAVTAVRVDNAKVQSLVQSIPSWAKAVINDLILRVEQSNDLFQKSFLALKHGMPLGRYLTLATQVAEGFIPLAETISGKTDDGTVSVDEVLDKLALILNEPFRDLRKIIDVLDNKGLVPWKSTGNRNRCGIKDLDNFRFFAKFVKDAKANRKLEEFLGVIPSGDRKMLRNIAEVTMHLPRTNDRSLTIETAEIDKLLVEKHLAKIEPRALKEAAYFKFLDLTESEKVSMLTFVPETLRLSILCIDAIAALDEIEDSNARLERKRTLIY